MKSSVIIATVIAVGVAGWILSGQMGGRETPPSTAVASADESAQPLPRVRVRRSRAEERVRELSLFGRTEADRTVLLKAQTAGRIAGLPVEKGQLVKAGTGLARLHMEDRAARLAEAEAVVDQYRIAWDAAQELEQKSFRSRVGLAESRANLESAKAALERIRVDIGHTAIRAPFDGVLEHLPVEVGDYVGVGDPVASVVDLDPIVVVSEVSEREIDQLRPGVQASVRLVTGRVLVGGLRYVARQGTAATRTFRVEIAIDNPDGTIVEGMTAEVRLPLAKGAAHRISPALLTLAEDGRIGIKAVNDAGLVVFHPVVIVDDTTEGMWLSGLPEALILITVGQEFVKAGQRVTPVFEGTIRTPRRGPPAIAVSTP